jgi:aspartyl-tRNA(Asn)/glutamyl-tRNA(Gln) amidotransferase subunit A
MTKSFGAMSIAQLSVLIQSCAADPVEVIEAVLDGIEAYADQSIFTALLRDRALDEARASSARLKDGRSRGLLEGIPVAWKDLFDIKGRATTAGSKVLATATVAGADATVVSALGQAGMIAVGCTNMSEFAFSGLGINPHYGTPHNPRSKDVPRIPGGSSSGAGAAVAAGLVPVAIGTDTGGSVRIPAAFNGIVGYKATRGRYPMGGVFPLARSLDSLGPLCRSVQDAIWVDAAMRGLTAAPQITPTPIRGLDLVIPDNIVFDGAEAGVIAAFEQSVEWLIAEGASVSRITIPAFDEILALMAKHGTLVTAEAFALHRERLAGPEADEMDRRVVVRTRLGESITVSDYLAILDARERLIAEVDRLVGDSFIAFPSVAHVAPPIAPAGGKRRSVLCDQRQDAAQHHARQFPRLVRCVDPLRHGRCGYARRLPAFGNRWTRRSASCCGAFDRSDHSGRFRLKFQDVAA